MNIGLLIDDLEIGFSAAITQGAQMAAKEIDANLFLFPGKYLKPDYLDKKMTAYNYQFNTIFPYAGVTGLDIVFVLLGSIASTRTREEQYTFLRSLGDVPIVSLCCEIEGYPSVCFDNRNGFFETIEHLIIEHDAKRIGFVAGPETNSDSQERQQVYLDVMAKHHLPVKDSYIVHGNFSDYCMDTIETLLDTNEPFDAIVFANDNMALAGYKVFEKRNIQVGKDILVVGFDDEPFAVSIHPPLTTVKANAIDLGYRAILLGQHYLETGSFDNCRTSSSMILRKSCGCTQTTGARIAKRLGVYHLEETNNLPVRQNIANYIFKDYIISNDKTGIQQDFLDFLNNILEPCKNHPSFAEYNDTICEQFSSLFSNDILSFTTTDRLFDILRLLHFLIENDDVGKAYFSELSDMFYNLYRTMAEKIISQQANNQAEIDSVNHRVNSFTREVIHVDDDIDISYSALIDTLRSMMVTSSFLYTFPNPITYKEDEEWQIPQHLCLKAYHTDDNDGKTPDSNRLLSVSSLLFNDITRTNQRVTRILVPLFSNEIQYGLMLFELDSKYYCFINSITAKVSSAMGTFYMLEQQRLIEAELEGNLRRAMQNNEYLENISKIDELSKIYNRRGFYEQLQNVLNAADMQGHFAVLLFGDLDGLKKINDIYGHDEGDLAIRTISEIMTDAFAADGIVARFGGDEFAAVILVSQSEFEQLLLPAFQHIKNAANERLNKPYTVDMSIGYTEFVIHKNVILSSLLETADELLYQEKLRRKTMRTDR